MSQHNAEALRAHLFQTIQAVRDKTLDPEAAQAISAVAKQIIDIDRTAIAYMDKIGGSCELGLIEKPKRQELPSGPKPALGFSR